MPDKRSKPGTVGENMPAALKGDQDDRGQISANYQGRPGNAIPGRNFCTHNDNCTGVEGNNAMDVSDWTQRHMQEARQKKKESNN